MNIVFTTSTKHFAQYFETAALSYNCIHFDDGELYVKLASHLQNQPVWVVASTPEPGDNFIELLLVLDALHRQNALINLIITYYGYARQDRASEGEALSAEVLSRCISLFPLKSINIVHAHSNALHNFLSFENHYPIKQICNIVRTYDYIVAPDHGAQAFVRHIAERCNIEFLFLEKERVIKDQARVTIFDGNADITGKRVLVVDDLISTGRTIISASEMLKKHGVAAVDVYATHGVFSGDCYDRILESAIDKVYVTNSLHQVPRDRLTIVDISPLLSSFMEL